MTSNIYLPVTIDPEYHYEAINVETQNANPSSLLWWMKRLIQLRKRSKAFTRGTLEILAPDNKKIFAFVRIHQDERVLVVANLSRYSQYVELDLRKYEGMVPEELFGRVEFPAIRTAPYFLSLGPHAFFWFALLEPARARTEIEAITIPHVDVQTSWHELLERRRPEIEALLPEYVRRRRWFRAKSRRIRGVSIADLFVNDRLGPHAAILVLRVDFYESGHETYLLPLAYTQREAGQTPAPERPLAILAHLAIQSSGEQGVLLDATLSPEFTHALLVAIAGAKTLRGEAGVLSAWSQRGLRNGVQAGGLPEARVGSAEQTNTSIFYGDEWILKLLRAVEEGKNPDVEITRFLKERVHFANSPELVGTLEYTAASGRPATVGVVQRLVPNRGDAWQFTLELLDRYYEAALAQAESREIQGPVGSLTATAQAEAPASLRELFGPYVPWVRLLGQRTAEMHLALAQGGTDPDFAPEPFSELHQQSLYQGARGRLVTTLEKLRRGMASLPEAVQEHAQIIADREGEIASRLQRVAARKIDALRIRCHGDYHLGQVLYTGDDFVIIDFEGEPARSLGERKFKRCPLRDVAGMLRSFHYAAVTALISRDVPAANQERAQRYAEAWVGWLSAAFFGAYLNTAKNATLVPAVAADSDVLLEFYLLEKCIYELGYELDNRPTWAHVPLAGLARLMAPKHLGGETEA